MHPAADQSRGFRRDGPEPFAAGGMAWTLHREMVLLAGWGRAILLQIAHPLVAQGVADHSAFTSERWGRLRRLDRTLRAMLTLTFGTEEEAALVASRINGIHDRVHGLLGGPAGGLAAGARYSAHDPALLTWVHATLLDSFLLTYQLFVGRLGEAERDRYCAEASGLEPRLGIPEGSLPRTEASLRAYLNTTLAGGAIEVTDTARRLSREIVSPPVPLMMKPLVGLVRLPTVGLLPPGIRRAYGFDWDPRRERALRAVAALARGTLPLVPSLLRYWPMARRAIRRARRSGRHQRPAPAESQP